MTAPAPRADNRPVLRLISSGTIESARASWWERRALHRELVGGCPDHWWNPGARRTAACTCDRFGG